MGIETRMQGFSHSNEPEKSMKAELRVGVTQSGLMEMMLRGDESPAQCDKTKEDGLK